MLKGVLARLIGLSAGKRTPLCLLSAHPLSSVARVNGCWASEWPGAAPLDFALATLHKRTRGLLLWMNMGTLVAGQGECHVEASCRRRPTSVPWVLASL